MSAPDPYIDSQVLNQLRKLIDDFNVQLTTYRAQQKKLLDQYRQRAEQRKIEKIRHGIST